MEPIEQEAEEERRLRRQALRRHEARAREDLEDRGDPAGPCVEAVALERRAEHGTQPIAEPLELVIPIRREMPERRQAGRRRDRIAVERATVDERARASGVELVHDLGAAAEPAGWVAATDDLAQGRQ